MTTFVFGGVLTPRAAESETLSDQRAGTPALRVMRIWERGRPGRWSGGVSPPRSVPHGS